MAIGKVRLAKLAELPEGRARAFDAGGVRVVLCRVGDRAYALEDCCSHDDAPLGDARLEGHSIECPRHGARFDVRDGSVLRMPAAAPVRTFAVSVERGEVYVEVE